MPVVVKDRKAAKFWAKPATATICINSWADGFSNISKASFTKGCNEVNPPTVTKVNGISIQKLKTPFSIFA